jgi:hypothetical protein
MRDLVLAMLAVSSLGGLARAQVIYCTAKTNSLGCVPSIAWSGVPNVSSSSGFVIEGHDVRNNKPGLLFYGVDGRDALPFQGGVLCVHAPLRRTPVVHSGGAPFPAEDCSGIYSVDMNSFAFGTLGGQPNPALRVVGTTVDCQWWGRDPGFAPPDATSLTDALEYTVSASTSAPLLLALDLNRPAALFLGGASPSLDATAGWVHVNSSDPCAVETSIAASLTAHELTVRGDVCGPVNAPVQTGHPVQAEPFAGLPYPSGLPLPLGPNGQITAPGTYQPGRYPKGFNMNGGVANLQPGIYSIGGQGGSVGVDLKGDSMIQGGGVMLFIEQGARVDIGGSGAGASLTPQPSGTYAGVAIFSHRQNAGNVISLGGGGVLEIDGAVYAVGGHVTIAGPQSKKLGRVIARTVEIADGTLVVTGR